MTALQGTEQNRRSTQINRALRLFFQSEVAASGPWQRLMFQQSLSNFTPAHSWCAVPALEPSLLSFQQQFIISFRIHNTGHGDPFLIFIHPVKHDIVVYQQFPILMLFPKYQMLTF